MKKLTNIALYGGAFDPPHKSHLSVIHQLLNMEDIDEVWLLPCGDRNDKKLVLNMVKRFQLMRKLLDDCCARVKVVDDEIKLSQQMGRMIQTYDLLKEMGKKYKQHEFHFVVGSDILSTIHTWGSADKLIAEGRFIIFPRKGHPMPENILPHHYNISHYIPEQISSSEIKKVLLDEELSKEEKMDKVGCWLENFTIDVLKQEGYL